MKNNKNRLRIYFSDRLKARARSINEPNAARNSVGFDLRRHDLRRAPIEERKAILAKLLRPPIDGIAFNEHYSGDGAIIYKHACALGCEGIVSRRLGGLAPEHIQLVPEHQDFGFQLSPRPKEPSESAADQLAKVDY